MSLFTVQGGVTINIRYGLRILYFGGLPMNGSGSHEFREKAEDHHAKLDNGENGDGLGSKLL